MRFLSGYRLYPLTLRAGLTGDAGALSSASKTRAGLVGRRVARPAPSSRQAHVWAAFIGAGLAARDMSDQNSSHSRSFIRWLESRLRLSIVGDGASTIFD